MIGLIPKWNQVVIMFCLKSGLNGARMKKVNEEPEFVAAERSRCRLMKRKWGLAAMVGADTATGWAAIRSRRHVVSENGIG